MIYSEAEAREAVIEAGHRLREAGLVARTWGNISARISEDQFVITPSGLAYETMRPEDLVIVNIQDGSHQGSRKPSSEKGIHADAYRLRPDIHFVIHTHQNAATVFGIGGMDLTKDLRALRGLWLAIHKGAEKGCREGSGNASGIQSLFHEKSWRFVPGN